IILIFTMFNVVYQAIIIYYYRLYLLYFFFQAEDGIRDKLVTGVQTCALPISIANRIVGGATPARSQNGLRSPMPAAQCRTASRRSEERRVGKEWRSRGSRVH